MLNQIMFPDSVREETYTGTSYPTLSSRVKELFNSNKLVALKLKFNSQVRPNHSYFSFKDDGTQNMGESSNQNVSFEVGDELIFYPSNSIESRYRVSLCCVFHYSVPFYALLHMTDTSAYLDVCGSNYWISQTTGSQITFYNSSFGVHKVLSDGRTTVTLLIRN